MKKIYTTVFTVIVLFVTLFSSFNAAAATGANEEKLAVHGFLDVGWYSQYVYWLNGGTGHDENVLQQSLVFVLEPVGLYAGLWSSYSPEGGANNDPGDEYDIFFGIKKRFNGFNFNLCYFYYNLYDLKNTKGDFHGFVLKTDFPKILGITPFLWLEKDIPVNDGTGGHLYRAGFAYTLKAAKQPINFNLSIAGHDNAFGLRSEIVSSGKLSVSSNFNAWKVIITPQVNFQQRLGYKIEDRGISENKIWYGINFSVPLF